VNSGYVSTIGGDRCVGAHFRQDYGYAQVNIKQYRPTERLYEGQIEIYTHVSEKSLQKILSPFDNL